MAEHNELGKRGEELASEFLAKKGYKILERNWRLGKNEVDIIAADGKYIVVVEVKTRQSATFGEPETAVTREKQRALIRAANAYIFRNNVREETRFDIIAIILKDDSSI